MNTTEPLTPVRNNTTAWTLIFGAWLVASVAPPGALLGCSHPFFLSPVVLTLPIGLFPFDRNVVRYALPLAVIGCLFAVFHLLLIAGVIPESIKPCTQGVPCSQTVIEWFGFVTIPLLSVLAFLTILALLIAAHLRR